MKSVLISIQPKWCAKIASGEKTIEVRKTKPKIATPFKVYIYCTLPPREELFGHGGLYEYANELIRLQSGEVVYDYGMRLCCDPEGRPYSSDNFLCRKVIGEFVCDNIFDICIEVSKPDDLPGYPFPCTGLTDKEIMQYLGNGKAGYGWRISDLVIYDEPKPLSDFTKYDDDDPRPCQKNPYFLCRHEYFDYSEDCEACDIDFDGEACPYIRVQRPPQSWCYVEELNNV